MKNRILLIIVVVLCFILVIVSSRENTTFFHTEVPKNIVVKNSENNNITNMDLENYIIGVLAAEMPASFNSEALKAQAVAARSYAMYKIEHAQGNYDVVTDVSNQSYIDENKMKEKWGSDFTKYYTKIKAAVDDTKGIIMTYQDKVIEAFYFAMSNGYTEEASLVFNEDLDYLESVPSIYEQDLKNFTQTITLTKNEVCTKLAVDCGNLTFTNIKRSNTNRVNTIDIAGITFKGTIVRQKLGLRSTDFDINIDNDKVTITTRGYGHGVGMSQYGANGMANAGFNYEEILNYYYKNIKITTI